MHPGRDCRECHSFAVAGTVYEAAGLNDPHDCLGVEGVSVLVEDAVGEMVSLETNEAGNFYLQGGSLHFPLTLHAERGGEMLSMALQGETGSCASCHTPAGDSGAAGRIIAP
jgi:hypothetical protein